MMKRTLLLLFCCQLFSLGCGGDEDALAQADMVDSDKPTYTPPPRPPATLPDQTVNVTGAIRTVEIKNNSRFSTRTNYFVYLTLNPVEFNPPAWASVLQPTQTYLRPVDRNIDRQLKTGDTVQVTTSGATQDGRSIILTLDRIAASFVDTGDTETAEDTEPPIEPERE